MRLEVVITSPCSRSRRGRGGVALHTIERGGTWGRAETRPWEHDEIPRDVAVVESRIAITVQRDLRSTLYLLERANLVYRRTIAVPCVEPQIVGHRNDTLWVTGMSPPPGPRRATCSVSTCGPEW